MEYALTADHHRVHALDAEKGQEYYCPVCGNQVIPRQGEVNSWHFAHVTSCMDDWKYDMSEWHRNWQNRFPESTREVVIEYKGESHRADILTGGYVIEFQHSPITSTEFERRNLFYTKAGYKVIWVFDETEAYANEYIIGSGDNCDKFVWKWPNRAIASVVPQFTSDVAIIFQLIAEDDENDCDWLVKAEWAIAEDDTYADYRRFFIDDGFTPDLFSPTGLRDIMLNKRRRFEAFLRNHSPYEPKCKRMKGNPRSWYICEKTKEWHDDQCLGCRHNLITEYRKGMDGLRDVLDSIEGASVQAEGEQYELTISCGRLQKPAEIAPIYRSASFVPLQDKVEFHNMLLRELCELYVIRRGNQYCIAKIPTEGIPEDRDSAIYNAVIGSKSGFLAYVAFLLADNYTEAGIEQQELMKRLAIGADTTETVIPSALYERLLRTAAFYPKRLDEVEKIMERVSPELVDDSFRMLIRTFREAVKRR